MILRSGSGFNSLTTEDVDELEALWRNRGAYAEDAILDDWIAEHGGHRWYRWYSLCRLAMEQKNDYLIYVDLKR